MAGATRDRRGVLRNEYGGLHIPRRSPRNIPVRHALAAPVDQRTGELLRLGPATPNADARRLAMFERIDEMHGTNQAGRERTRQRTATALRTRVLRGTPG